MSVYKYQSFEKSGQKIPCEIMILLSKLYNVSPDVLINDKYSIAYLKDFIDSSLSNSLSLGELKKNLLDSDDKLTYHTSKRIINHYRDLITDYIKLLIKQQEYNLESFCTENNFDYSDISSYLSKKRFLDCDTLIKICEKYGLKSNSLKEKEENIKQIQYHLHKYYSL